MLHIGWEITLPNGNSFLNQSSVYSISRFSECLLLVLISVVLTAIQPMKCVPDGFYKKHTHTIKFQLFYLFRFQTGALYPFSRNHNTYCGNPQEVYAFGADSSTLAAGRASLKLRYSLMKYYYSLFVRNKGVGSVFIPTWYNFPYSHVKIIKIIFSFFIFQFVSIFFHFFTKKLRDS